VIGPRFPYQAGQKGEGCLVHALVLRGNGFLYTALVAGALTANANRRAVSLITCWVALDNQGRVGLTLDQNRPKDKDRGKERARGSGKKKR